MAMYWQHSLVYICYMFSSFGFNWCTAKSKLCLFQSCNFSSLHLVIHVPLSSIKVPQKSNVSEYKDHMDLFQWGIDKASVKASVC